MSSGLDKQSPRLLRRRWFALVALLLLATIIAAPVAMWLRRDALADRLVGAWELVSTPTGTTERRTIEFDAKGRFWIYTRGKRNVEIDTCHWTISRGDLVVVFEDPLTQGGPPTDVAKELGRRLFDPQNVERSYRYAVEDDGGDVITISLIEERGNAPAEVQRATLTRKPANP